MEAIFLNSEKRPGYSPSCLFTLKAITLVVLVSACFLILSSSVQASGTWKDDMLCGKTNSRPEEATIPGCEKAFCLKTAMAGRVCSCRKSPGIHEVQMVIENHGKTTQSWNAAFAPPATLANFRVENADITGSGREDIVVATMSGMSNGMGVQYWEVRAIVNGIVSKPAIVEDYGIMGFLTRSKSGKRCALLSTRWLWGQEPKRGRGLYLAGKWFVYDMSDNAWTPAIDRPVVYRRYLDSFEKLRLEQLNSDNPIPLSWFVDKETKELIGPYPKFD